MKLANRNWIAALAVIAVSGWSSMAVGDETAEREFTLGVLPVLKAKCFACHGEKPGDVKGDFDVRSRAALLTGGESGEPAIVPGEPEQSLLYQAVRWEGYEMPPKENDRLSDDEIAAVRRWIIAGAPWPDEAAQKKHREAEWSIETNADGVIVKTSGGTSDEWTYRRYQPDDLWAIRPVQAATLPVGVNAIDYFVRKRLQDHGVPPAPAADPLTLLRRASYDLLGMPPTPEEASAFLAAWDKSPELAWSELIERLLASPHYGERWAQHWLDVTRYADTGGYSNDYERSNMWRYRDYVIRCFNEDKPYNEFIVEQIAGDELWEQQPAKERDSELLVATGFLRMGPWDPAMVKNDEARQMYLDDVVNAVGQTFLSTTMRCVKCHDHKFDPIPTRDYYRMYAAFAGTQLAERSAPFLPEENLEGFDTGRAHVQRLLKYAVDCKDSLYNKQEEAARDWFREHGLEYATPEDRKDLPDEVKPPRHVGLDYVDQGQLKVREQDEWIWTRTLERYEPMAQSVYNGSDPTSLNARKLRMPLKMDLEWRPESHILTGGSLQALGDAVGPGVLSAVGLVTSSTPSNQFTLADSLTGRRLALARWIAHEDNPLTSRSIANRVWQYHFGKPIAGNPNNFGVKGAKPSHPELLDQLAAEFLANGWSLKHLHRLIMMSETYRQASHHPQLETLLADDPNNELFAYYPIRRLSAEELRDAMLRITGELNPTLGGVPAKPEINMEVALQPRMIQFSLAPAYEPSRTPQQRDRRSIYAYRVRGQADPFLEVFNQPNPNESCELRDSAAVSPQAFTLMNSDLMTDRAIAFAVRLSEEATDPKTQVRRAFQLAFNRLPDEAEQARLTDYVSRMIDYHQGVKPRTVTYPSTITRSLVEEFTGQPFEYEEVLPVFENYVPDKKASDVSAETRAIADLCLMLFNTHEFLYVY